MVTINWTAQEETKWTLMVEMYRFWPSNMSRMSEGEGVRGGMIWIWSVNLPPLNPNEIMDVKTEQREDCIRYISSFSLSFQSSSSPKGGFFIQYKTILKRYELYIRTPEVDQIPTFFLVISRQDHFMLTTADFILLFLITSFHRLTIYFMNCYFCRHQYFAQHHLHPSTLHSPFHNLCGYIFNRKSPFFKTFRFSGER